MATEKWRRRGTFATSVTIREIGGVGANPNVTGFIHTGDGTVAMSDAAGTNVDTQAGSVTGAPLLDLTRHRLRIPVQGTTIGSVTPGWGLTVGGSAGALKAGYSAASAFLGINVGNGSAYVLSWPLAGGSVVVFNGIAGA